MKKFETPELEVTKISVEDVITVSGGGEEVNPPPFPGGGSGMLPVDPM